MCHGGVLAVSGTTAGEVMVLACKATQRMTGDAKS